MNRFACNHLVYPLLFLIFLVLAIQYIGKIHGRSSRSAFLRWQNQIEDLWKGEDIWRKHGYPNPPIMAMILSPFFGFPGLAGPLVWFAAKAALTLLALRWFFAGFDKPFPWWSQALTVVLVLKPIEGDLVHGNVNLFILFLVVGGLAAFLRGREILGGSLLGMGIACKLTPLLFVPYFAWKRAWKMTLAAAVSWAVFTLVLPGGIFGFDRNLAFLDSWLDYMVWPYLRDGKITTDHQNQSLPGLAHRLLTESPSYREWREDRWVPLAYHNLAGFDPALVQALVRALFVAYLGLLAWKSRARLENRSDPRWWLEFGLVALGMLLFSERTWKHHCAILLIPLGVLVHRLAHEGTLRRTRAILLGMVGLLMLATTSGLFRWQEAWVELAEIYGAYTLIFGILLLALPLRARSVGEKTFLPAHIGREITYQHSPIDFQASTS